MKKKSKPKPKVKKKPPKPMTERQQRAYIRRRAEFIKHLFFGKRPRQRIDFYQSKAVIDREDRKRLKKACDSLFKSAAEREARNRRYPHLLQNVGDGFATLRSVLLLDHLSNVVLKDESVYDDALSFSILHEIMAVYGLSSSRKVNAGGNDAVMLEFSAYLEKCVQAIGNLHGLLAKAIKEVK